MALRQFARVTRLTIASAAEGVVRFAKLERVLATVCLLIPVLLIWFDNGNIRPSISEYYNMVKDQVFYFPLTVAAMLFVVNGVVKEKHVYNTILGAMLAGVILFNCHDTPVLHFAFASVFFGGNGVVILVYSSRKERWFKAIMVALILGAMLGCFAFHWFSLFWAEWISFAIIALHYMLESWGVID
jgi:hypothetical protein